MVHTYRTIESSVTGLYKEKGSKFLAFAFPVTSDEEVRQALDGLRKEYFDARHHCYAYILGPEKKQFRAFDDGEPNHSAGDPILGQIRSMNLTNVLVVVVRYFGGVKLGVGGLITAYRAATSDALRQARVVERIVTTQLELRYGYTANADVMRLLKEFDMEVVDQTFTDTCSLVVQVSLRNRPALEEKLRLMNALGTAIAWEEATP